MITLVLYVLSGCASQETRQDETEPARTLSTADKAAPGGIVAMTYNIRYSNDKDGIHNWSNRKEAVVKTILDTDPGILSLQEAKPEQLEYIDGELPGYARVGEGRMRNGNADEYCPIYYKKDLFELVETKTLWYSETPEVPGSMGWDTSLPRIYTYAVLIEKESGLEFVAMNTHLDHKGHTARIKSVGMLLEAAKGFGEIPVVVMGDFNSQENHPGYRIIAEDGYLKDGRYVSVNEPQGPDITTNGFGAFDQTTAIDYIFVNGGFIVNSHETIENSQGDFYPSDHYPIVCDIIACDF